MSERMWIVVSTAEVARYRASRIRELLTTGVDMLYPRRFSTARRLLRTENRVVIHFGGSAGSHAQAQHLVAAGRVAEMARHLTQDDADRWPTMLELTKQAFPRWNQTSVNGIIRFDLRDCQSRGVIPLPRTLPDGTELYRPRVGSNFIPIEPDSQAHELVDDWWHRVFVTGPGNP